jgi:hypothetical protein
MPKTVTWRQALAWRMQRQLLEPVGTRSVPEVVRRICGVQAQVASAAELAVRLRRQRSKAGEVRQALAKGSLLKTWAMRGTLHLLTPQEGGAFLSLLAAGRSWHRPSWQRYFGVDPRQMERLREATRGALAGEPLTRDELIEAVTARRGLVGLGDALRSGWGTLLKPIAWQGDLCFAKNRGNNVTFTLPALASDQWAGVPDADDAAPVAISAYLRAHGPATAERFARWLAGGWFGKRQLAAWLAELGDQLAEVDVEGERAYVMADDLDGLCATRPGSQLRLLPGFDQYVLGSGTDNVHVVPARRRAAVSRQSGWISPVIVLGGVVSGTWEVDRRQLSVAWFSEAGGPPTAALAREVERLASILGQDLQLKTRVI